MTDHFQSPEDLKISLEKTKNFFLSKVGRFPETGVVLGSGWGAFVDRLKDVKKIPFAEIPGFHAPTVKGHGGQLAFGKVEGVDVVVMQGRIHHYEGHSMQKVVFPIRSLGWSGLKSVILTNAAGGLGENMISGDFMVIEDHIGLFCRNPLIGPNPDFLGTRFPDMTHCYDSDLTNKIEESMKTLKIRHTRGIYAYLTGPSFESKAEILLLQKLGVHAVGMSTVPETIAAHHMGIKVAGISCISNLAAGLSAHIITHEEVNETAKAVEEKFNNLLSMSLKKIGAP